MRQPPLSACIFALLVLVTGCAKYKVTPITGNALPSSAEGIAYNLPRKVILATVPVIQTLHRATALTKFAQTRSGDFADLPNIELPSVIETSMGPASPPVQQWEFGTVALGSYAEPDPQAAYFVEISGTVMENRSLELELNKIGVLTSGKTKIEDRTLAIAVSTFETIAKVGGAVLGSGGGPLKMSAATLPAKVVKKRAIELRDKLKTIQTVRQRLLSGEAAGPAPETFKQMLAGLTMLEEAIKREFYISTTKRYDIELEIRPDFTKQVLSNVVVFQLGTDKTKSQNLLNDGVYVNPNTLPSSVRIARLPAEIQPSDLNEFAPLRELRVTIKKDDQYHVPGPPAKQRKGSRGFYYRIPGRAIVEFEEHVFNPDPQKAVYARTLAQKAMLMPRAGTIASLPPGTSSMKVAFKFGLYEDTGAIKSIGVDSQALDDKLITRTGDAAAGFLDKVAAARAAKAEKKSGIERATDRLNQIKALMDAGLGAGIPIPEIAGMVPPN